MPSAMSAKPRWNHSSASPPSVHAAPTQVSPMIAVRFKPLLTRTPALRRFARRTTTAPGTGRRFAADPRIVTCRISSFGGW